MSDFKKYLVVQDHEKKFHIWTLQEYYKYIRGCAKVGAGSAYKIIIDFNGDEDRLKDTPDPAVEKLVEALAKAVQIIKVWHGEDAFDIYYDKSPEMRLIREALKQYKP